MKQKKLNRCFPASKEVPPQQEHHCFSALPDKIICFIKGDQQACLQTLAVYIILLQNIF